MKNAVEWKKIKLKEKKNLKKTHLRGTVKIKVISSPAPDKGIF